MKDGGAIAMNQTLECYIEQDCEISLLALNTSRHWVDESTLPIFYNKLKRFETVFVKTNVNPLSAFFNLFTDKSYNVERFVNKQVEQKFIELLQSENYDIIQFESIYTSPYLKTARKYSKAKCVCRVHNIEHVIWQRLSENETSIFKKGYLKLLTTRLRNYELDILKQFDLLLPISKRENEIFIQQNINHCHYLPFGVKKSDVNFPNIQTEMNSCYHIGSMDWMPNIEGVQWFLDEVWPEIYKQFPQITFYLAGKNMPLSLVSKESEHVKIIGEVEDFVSFSLEKNIMIVPLLSGAGVRIKVLEAMSIGKTILTTSIGAEGIGALSMKQIIICNTIEEFLNSFKFCIENPEESKAIGMAAKLFVEEHFQREKIYSELVVKLKALTQEL
ncbi:MAG: group 1 glycosyl transferase [Bacteroidetes bacterium OLB11]|nr:MAG: group 1 glycosyl transferase [Bacteroidetes bacterium OLB11]